jgi:hypothetical protein
MVESNAQLGWELELYPILYHLAADPEHARLRAVNQRDLALLENSRTLSLMAVRHQALRWQSRNAVADGERTAAAPVEQLSDALARLTLAD